MTLITTSLVIVARFYFGRQIDWTRSPEYVTLRCVGLSKTGNRGLERRRFSPRKVRTPQSRMLDNVQ